jgi:hypothetical protein
MMEMGVVTGIFESIRKTWHCGYCRDQASSLMPCPACKG